MLSKKRLMSFAVLPALLLSITAGCSGNSGASSAAAAPSSVSSAAPDDNYPTKPIHLIIGSAPGGATEAICRRFQTYLEKELGQPLMFDFIDGAGGIVGTDVLKNSDPDGYTISVRPETNLIIAKLLLGADFDIDDFDYLVRFTHDPGAFFVKKDAPYNTMKEFIDYVKTKPEGTVTIGLGNITDVDFLALRQIEEAAGVKFNIVGYDSGGKARLAVVNGEVAASDTLYFGATDIWDSTKVLAIDAVVENVPALKDVPLMKDAIGAPDFHDISSNYCIITPAGFKEKYPQRAEKLEKALQSALNNPDFLKAMADQGLDGYISVAGSDETTQEVKDLDTYLTSNKDKFTLK